MFRPIQKKKNEINVVSVFFNSSACERKAIFNGPWNCLCSYKANKEEYLRLRKAEMPMVFYDRIPHGLDVSQVIVDDYKMCLL